MAILLVSSLPHAQFPAVAEDSHLQGASLSGPTGGLHWTDAVAALTNHYSRSFYHFLKLPQRGLGRADLASPDTLPSTVLMASIPMSQLPASSRAQCLRRAPFSSPFRFQPNLRCSTSFIAASKKTDSETKTAPPSPSKGISVKPSSSWGASPPPPPGQKQTWRVFDLQAYNQKWDVPWGPLTLLAGLGAWGLSFAAVGFYVVPKAYQLSGFDFRTATTTDKAMFTLVVQVVQTIAGVGVVRAVCEKYRNPAPLDKLTTTTAFNEPSKDASSAGDGLFNYRLSEPFRKPDGWLFWGVVGMFTAPIVVTTLAYALTSVGYEKAYSDAKGTVDGIAPIISADLPTYLSLLTVTGVLAPVLEETVFRGFLLTTLTKYLPTWLAVLGSSVAFGAAHLSARDFPVLTGLGILLGFSYVRSRNLLTPMLIHGAWNSTVLTVLFAIASSGIDVQQLLQEMRNVQ